MSWFIYENNLVTELIVAVYAERIFVVGVIINLCLFPLKY